MRAARLFANLPRVIVLIALFGLSNGNQVEETTVGVTHRPADTFRRRLQGAGRRGKVAWKSIKDADAVIRSSDHAQRPGSPEDVAARAANATTGARIAFGEDLPYARYPFAAYFFADGSICTGSLIAPRLILTAAHCVHSNGEWIDPDNSLVLLGGVDVYKMTGYGIAQIFIPGDYEREEDLYGDIALVELAYPAEGIKPVQMVVPNANLAKVSSLVAVGWGQTEDRDLPNVARYTSLTLFSNSECNAISQETFGKELEEDKVCFGMDDDPPVTVCPGDSGGPLIARNSKGPVVVAITSYGPNICGEVPIINMGTSVSYWRDFLEEILSFNNLRGLYSPSKSNTLENNRCYQGPIIGKLTTSAWRCAEKCRATSSCSAWTHSYTTRRCVLFRSANRYYMDENCTSGYFE